jgi:hypothetical protein
MNYDPNADYSICLFNKNKMYLCKKESFKQTTEGTGRTFSVTLLPGSIDNLPDFKKAIEI